MLHSKSDKAEVCVVLIQFSTIEGVRDASSLYPYIDAYLFDLRSDNWHQAGASPLRAPGYE